MTKEISRLIIHEHKRLAEIIFIEQDLNEEDILPALNNFEDKYRSLDTDERFDIVVIHADITCLKLNYNFHAMISDSLDVRTISKWEKIITFFEKLKKSTLITLQGEVTGALLQLALVCDNRICLPDTTFKFTEINDGYLPGMAVFRICKYVGLGHAKQLLFTGKKISATEAAQLGFIDSVVNNLEEGISEFAAYVHPNNLEAITLARRLLHESYQCSYEEEIGDYLAAQARCFEHLKNINRSSK